MRALVLSCVVFCAGCSVFAGKADYADYRRVRLASDLQTRAVAMQQYVQRHPNGHWHDEIQALRSQQDLTAFEAGKDTRSGLEHYLLAFPDGAFVAQARGRLSAVALIEQRNKAAEQQAEQLARARKVRTDELRRTWLGRFVGFWTNTLTSVSNWGDPIADVARINAPFSRAFAAQPRPRCTQDECVKYYASQYAVPVPGGNRLERTLSLVLRLRLRGGKLERAELLLPERGFSRWYELEHRQAIADGDADGRVTAANWAMERLLPIITALGEGVSPRREPGVPNIDRPAIGPTGELTDTSIEAPSDPQNRVSGEADNAGIGVQTPTAPAPGVSDLVKPSSEPPPSDMMFAPVGVGKHGQRVAVAPSTPTPPPAADGGGPEAQAPGEVMVLDPLAVTKSEHAAPEAPTTPTPAPATTLSAGAEAARAGWVRGFQWQKLHLVAFAASLDANSNGYDGLIIERAAASAAPKGKAGQTKPVPRAH